MHVAAFLKVGGGRDSSKINLEIKKKYFFYGKKKQFSLFINPYETFFFLFLILKIIAVSLSLAIYFSKFILFQVQNS